MSVFPTRCILAVYSINTLENPHRNIEVPILIFNRHNKHGPCTRCTDRVFFFYISFKSIMDKIAPLLILEFTFTV